MKNILAGVLMLMGAIFVSSYAICKTVALSANWNGRGELILLLLGGLAAIFAGAVLFAGEFKKKH
ncbi:MAG: hypothetical protein FWD39_06555 [Clostridiales bacterium]|nr:hypothetical protein [Clostridiales bacterium]